jgi:hypothetical protein
MNVAILRKGSYVCSYFLGINKKKKTYKETKTNFNNSGFSPCHSWQDEYFFILKARKCQHN